MKNERVIAYKMSKQISKESMNDISAAGHENTYTTTYDSTKGFDHIVDISNF